MKGWCVEEKEEITMMFMVIVGHLPKKLSPVTSLNVPFERWNNPLLTLVCTCLEVFLIISILVATKFLCFLIRLDVPVKMCCQQKFSFLRYMYMLYFEVYEVSHLTVDTQVHFSSH